MQWTPCSDSPTAYSSNEFADLLDVEPGDEVQVLFARATQKQKLSEMKVIGLFDAFPASLKACTVVNVERQMELIPSTNTTFFLAQTTDPSDATLDRVVAELQEGPGTADALQIDTRASALDKDQSSLAALNIRGLLTLDSAYALAMAATAITIFVFGLLLQRRREYVTLRAQGMRIGKIRSLLVTESLGVAVVGAGVGALIGAVMAYFLVTVLTAARLYFGQKSLFHETTSSYLPHSYLLYRWLRPWRPRTSFVVYLQGSCCVMNNNSRHIQGSIPRTGCYRQRDGRARPLSPQGPSRCRCFPRCIRSGSL